MSPRGTHWYTWCSFCSYNCHLSQTRIIVERVFGKIKVRFKVLHGVTDRRTHKNNARMICATAVLHNLLIDIGDRQFKVCAIKKHRHKPDVMRGKL